MHVFFNAFGGGVLIIEELFITPNKTAAATCAAVLCVRLPGDDATSSFAPVHSR
jgi:hypothetical protein